MSLINDALKKANQTPVPITPAQTKEPLRVAAHHPPPPWPMFVVLPLVALVFGVGTLLVVKGWGRTETVSAKETAVVSEKPEVSVAASPIVAMPAKAETPHEVAATNATPAPTFPTLKLQGVIWNPQRPSVVINGKSLFVGEKVERAIVTAIESDSVTVVWNGEQRVLTLR